jgi:hypothetical protein
MRWVDKAKVWSSLRELSDVDYQRRVWILAAGPEMSSFSEAVCELFDDSGLGRALEGQSLVFGAEADHTLRTLDKAIAGMPASDLSAPSMIDHPQMVRIRELAKRALDQIAAAARSSS